MKRSDHEIDRSNLMCSYGALLFGVPSLGMDVTALASMVGHLPARTTLHELDHHIGNRLRHKQHREFCEAFNFKDSVLARFFELDGTPTVIRVSRESEHVYQLAARALRSLGLHGQKWVVAQWPSNYACWLPLRNSGSALGKHRPRVYYRITGKSQHLCKVSRIFSYQLSQGLQHHRAVRSCLSIGDRSAAWSTRRCDKCHFAKSIEARARRSEHLSKLPNYR
jgi:hypothetical protein